MFRRFLFCTGLAAACLFFTPAPACAADNYLDESGAVRTPASSWAMPSGTCPDRINALPRLFMVWASPGRKWLQDPSLTRAFL